MYKISVAIVLINGLLITAAPQYGPPSGPPAAPHPQPQSAPAPAHASYEAQPLPHPQSAPAPAQPSYAAQPQPQSAPQPSYAAQPQPQSAPQPSYAAQSQSAPAPQAPAPAGNAAAKSNSDLTVQCKANPSPDGTIKYDCSGANKDAITLKTEHILWLESQAGASQNLDIEIPNYNIDEFIKAAYKQLGPQEGAKINILLKKPDVAYNAEKDEPAKQAQQPPAVSLNYQPVDKVSVHYPTQKAYSNGGDNRAAPQPAPAAPQPAPQPAPAPAPARQQGGGAYSRPLRESGTSYYFYRQ